MDDSNSGLNWFSGGFAPSDPGFVDVWGEEVKGERPAGKRGDTKEEVEVREERGYGVPWSLGVSGFLLAGGV